MKAVPVWVYYSVYRVLMFAVPLAILLALGFEPIIATLLAAAIGLCLSFVILRKPRESLSRDLYQVRHGVRHGQKDPVRSDDETEDAAVERAEWAKREYPDHVDAASELASSERASSERASSEREREAEQHSVAQGSEAGEFQGKDQLP